MVAIDTSMNAARAREVAVQLAEKTGAELIVLHAVPIPSYTFAEIEVGAAAPSMFHEYYEAAQKEGKNAVDGVVGLAEAKGVKATGIILGLLVSVVETIVEYAAENKIDLIIVRAAWADWIQEIAYGKRFRRHSQSCPLFGPSGKITIQLSVGLRNPHNVNRAANCEMPNIVSFR